MSEVKTKVPQLRFPGFSDEWEEKKLGNISKLTSSKRVYLDDYVQSGIPFYRGKEISELQKGLTPKDILYISNESYEQYKSKYGIPQVDDILITAVGTLGNILRIKDRKPFYFKDGNLIWIKDIYEYSNFLEILLEVKNKEIQKTSIGSTQRALTMVELRKLLLPFPAKQEQQKIAAFLTAVDTKIEQLSKKQALFSEYKKGLMQQIFSQAIRFKADDGSEFPDWEDNTIDKALHSYKLGGNYSNSEAVTDYPLIKMGNLDRGNIKLNKLQYINTEENIDDSDKINYGDLFFNTRNTLDLVGKVAIWRDELPCAYYNSNLMKMEFSDNFFMNYRFNSFDGIKALRRVATGTTSVAAIYTKDLLKIKFSLPTLSEQQKIANFLSSIDTKIEQAGKQLDESKQFKKALLQQMFV